MIIAEPIKHGIVYIICNSRFGLIIISEIKIKTNPTIKKICLLNLLKFCFGK